MRWGAVFAGWFVATGTATILYEFGLAVGFSAFNPRSSAAVAHGVSAGVIVWMILTWGAALWIGAMFASWFDGRNDTEMGVVRGFDSMGHVDGGDGIARRRWRTAAPWFRCRTRAHRRLLQRNAHTAEMMWAAFGSLVLLLLTSAFGGWLGARHVHHVYHLREYAAHGRQS